MRVEWSLAAQDDLDRIQAYIEQDSPRAAEPMWLRIYERVELQARSPWRRRSIERGRQEN